MAEDFYQVLGVSKNSSEAELKKAYRKLSRENHPDSKPNDKAAAEKFKQVQEAYSVLSDSEKRQKYDRFGHAAFQGGGRGGGSPFGGGQVDLSDLFGGGGGGGFDFGDLFGGGGGRRAARARKGQDVETTIDVPFTTAAEGGSYSLTINTSGKPEQITARIPAGVDSGSVIRLSGQGHPGMGGGPNGDLMVKIRVAPHPYFRRDGANLLVDVPISLTEAALGAKVDVPTLSEGLVTVTVPAGSASGTRLRLRGKGIINRKTNEPGDLYAILQIVVPKNLDDRSRELLEEFAELHPEDLREDRW
ncbi:MAG: DnaJ domain-containing protein [Planctomycetota bacterium]|nr:DnaJ domain-containing protein [Planctomycetota bacterium]MDA0917728.1 DnaJ domain-containing protein [Planctomycetota bacterium]MDA1158056.1 DnaJ domain-containing protein [Planctomycetota bacterium]